MELWIRSQDKKMLTKADYIYIDGNEVLGGNHYMINKSLGIYATKDRTLEVLDEIQNHLYEQNSIIMTTESLNLHSFKIYEMPQE